MENEKKKSNLKVILVSASLVLIATILAVSFAYFTIEYEVDGLYSAGGNAKSNEPSITFTENKDGILLDGAYPMPDAVGTQKSDEYIFTVKNNDTSKNVKIQVYLQVSESNTLSDNLVRLQYNSDIKTVGSITETGSVVDTGYNKAYSLGSFILRPNSSASNSVKIWIAEEGTIENALNKNWRSKIYVKPVFTDEKAPTPTGKATDVLKILMNDPSITNYEDGNKGEMFTFTHNDLITTTEYNGNTYTHSATQVAEWAEAERTDYRYIGATPNNYIKFNDETWRIIGVFTVENEAGVKEQRVKIIREASLGSFSWDKKADGTYTNEWPTSSLATMLNGDYVNSGGNFTYTWYNSSGTAANATVQGLNSTANSQIDPVKWYLGGSRTYENLGGPDYYNFERGTTIYSGRTTNVIANVGLMYPSDYVYTYSNGVDNTCYTNGYNCKTSSSGTPTNSWLYNSLPIRTEWLIPPTASNWHQSFARLSEGYMKDYINSNGVSIAYESRPVVYLRSDVEIISGDGSSESPYILKEITE